MKRVHTLALLIAGALLLGACSSGPSSGHPTGAPSAGPGVRVQGSGVELVIPGDWTSRVLAPRGLVVAALPADLAADAPAGPRFTASTEQGELPDPAALFAAAQDQDVSVRGAPVQVTVDGIEGVSLESQATIDGVTINSRQVVVPLGGGRAASFILEAPADQWEANQAALTAILASVHFSDAP